MCIGVHEVANIAYYMYNMKIHLNILNAFIMQCAFFGE